MASEPRLNQPWFVAVWPGMGHVAISAGYYLLAKLNMELFAELSPQGLFDVEHVEVKGGLIRPGRLPRSRFFVWRDPQGKRDLVVFLGEAQPPTEKYALCRKLLAYARELGVERVFTFAAMATHMHPEHDSRVFAATTQEDLLAELKETELELLEEGHIGGLNGVLLGAAAESDMQGTCLLGEMPHIFAQLPFPKASLAVLRTFTKLARIEVDFSELSEQAHAMDEKLGELLASVEQAIEQREPEEEEAFGGEMAEEEEAGNSNLATGVVGGGRSPSRAAFEYRFDRDGNGRPQWHQGIAARQHRGKSAGYMRLQHPHGQACGLHLADHATIRAITSWPRKQRVVRGRFRQR